MSSQPDQIAFDCLRLIENNTIHPQEAIECLDTLKCFLRFSDEYVNFEKLFRYIHNVTKTVSDLLLRQSSPLHGLEDRMLHLVVIGIDSLATMRKGLPNTDTPITNPFPRADVEIIDLLLQSKWPEHLRFHLIQIIFSIEPLLKKRHSPLFQVCL